MCKMIWKWWNSHNKTKWLIEHRGYLVLAVAWIFVATAGLKARTTECSMEHWFVFAAGISNLVALFDLGPAAFKVAFAASTRAWLVLEILFFSVVLGVDVELALGEHEELLMIAAAVLVIAATLMVGTSKNPKDHIGTLTAALLFSVSLFLVPPLLEWLKPLGVGFMKLLLPKSNEDFVSAALVDRSYAWVHLISIPLVYLIVDYNVGLKQAPWKKFLFLDRSLLLAGLACTISGLSFSLLRSAQEADSALYETGAAAVILLVGNAWYLVTEKANGNAAQSAT